MKKEIFIEKFINFLAVNMFSTISINFNILDSVKLAIYN